MIRVGVLGAGGRMGQAIVDAVHAEPALELAGGIERPGHPMCGSKLGDGLVVCSNVLALAHRCDVLIDFTTPDALRRNLEAAAEGRAAIVVGTTGLTAADQAAIDAAARSVAVLWASNMSLGVNLLARLVEDAAGRLGDDWDIEIVEMHHRDKRDAPSGTALALGEAAARGRGTGLDGVTAWARNAARKVGEIGFASLRGGTVAGDHKVVLAGRGEQIELGHRAETRDVFARGAVKAAAWLAGRTAGRYTMADVLDELARPAAIEIVGQND